MYGHDRLHAGRHGVFLSCLTRCRLAGRRLLVDEVRWPLSLPACAPLVLLSLAAGQARSQGGFGGCGRTPLFLGPKKKVDGVRVWQLRVPGAIAPSCTVVGLRTCIHGPNRILKVLQCRSMHTSNDRHSFECPLSTSSVVFCVDCKVMRLKFTNEPSVL